VFFVRFGGCDDCTCNKIFSGVNFLPPPPQPFYGHFFGITRVIRCLKRTSGLYGAREINRGRDTDHPAGCHSIRTNQCPPPASPIFFTDRMPFLPPNQRHQSTEGNYRIRIREKTLEFSSTVLPAPSPYLGVNIFNRK